MASKAREKRESLIPISVIKRLPVYYRFLTNLMNKDVERISSSELADKLGITASQIRQDLCHFGSFGQRGYGYRVKKLQKAIGNILGLNQEINMVLVGAGHLGTAIANYPNFKNRGFYIKAVFDKDPGKIGRRLAGCTIMEIEYLEEYLKNNEIDIGILAIPVESTSEVAKLFEENGVKGIWNFAPISLKLKNGIKIENVHISESLMT